MKIRLSQFKSSFEDYKEAVREMHFDELKIIWFDDYYGDKQAGMLEYEGKMFRFENINEVVQSNKPKIFAVFELNKHQFFKEAYWNDVFNTYVVDGTIQPLNGTKVYRPESEHHLFYDRYKKARPYYLANPVCGWFKQS